MAEKPLRLKLFIFLLVLDQTLYWLFSPFIPTVMETFPPELHPWIFVAFFLLYLAWFLIIVCLWIRNRLAYIIALIILTFSILDYAFELTTKEPTLLRSTLMTLEIIQVTLLLSLFNYFFRRR